MDIRERIKNVIVKNLVEARLSEEKPLPLNPAGSGAKVGRGKHRKGPGAGETPGVAGATTNTSIAGPGSWVHTVGADNPRRNRPNTNQKGDYEGVPAWKLPPNVRGF